VPLDLSGDHGHGIGRKAHVERRIVVVERLDKAHAAYLVQVLIIHAPPQKPLDNALYEAGVALNKLLARVRVSRAHPVYELQ